MTGHKERFFRFEKNALVCLSSAAEHSIPVIQMSSQRMSFKYQNEIKIHRSYDSIAAFFLCLHKQVFIPTHRGRIPVSSLAS